VPELPEVETIARGLARRVSRDTIDSVWIGSRPQPLKSPAVTIAATLEGRRIVRVHRAGKHIVFDLETAAGSNGKRKSSGRRETRQAASLH
jgi:formamidopyrimidine-DNA glycosylase